MRFSRIFIAGLLCAIVATATAFAVGPKAYVGLFKDNAVAVLDTATNQVLTTIAIPAGPHGLAMTPNGKTLLAAVFGAGQV